MTPPRPPALVAAALAVAAVLVACVPHRRAVITHATPETQLVDPRLRAMATVNGKYEELIAVFTVPEDAARWGAYHDYGWWPGGTWAGVSGIPPGHWVYVEPSWYIWRRTTSPAP